MHITALPDELLIEIVSYLEFERPDLVNLARVCRALHLVTQGFLFRHIEIPYCEGPGYDELFDEPLSTVRNGLLERSLEENPGLCAKVYSCGPIETRHPSFQLMQSTRQILSAYSNLKEVWLHSTQLHLLDSVSLTDIPCAPKITTIKLEGQITDSHIISCMLLFNIHTLIAGLFDTYNSQPRTYLKGTSTSLRSLTLSGETDRPSIFGTPNLETSKLRQILSFCPSLEELSTSLALGLTWLAAPPPEYSLSAAGIAEALSPVRRTLKRLRLNLRKIGRNIVYSSGFPIDFSSFEALALLHINASYMIPFRWEQQSENNFSEAEAERNHFESRQDLYRVLPQSLETLEITFPPQIGLFCDSFVHTEGYSHQTSATITVPSEQYDWMFQFPKTKHTTLPRLRKISLKDEELLSWKGRLFEWKQPLDVECAFAEAFIALDVRVYFCDGS